MLPGKFIGERLLKLKWRKGCLFIIPTPARIIIPLVTFILRGRNNPICSAAYIWAIQSCFGHTAKRIKQGKRIDLKKIFKTSILLWSRLVLFCFYEYSSSGNYWQKPWNQYLRGRPGKHVCNWMLMAGAGLKNIYESGEPICNRPGDWLLYRYFLWFLKISRLLLELQRRRRQILLIVFLQ